MEREFMEYDVVVVGAGPAGLSAACRLKQLQPDVSVCVVEKGSEVGAHILSGAVLEPTALTELFPDWKERQAPLHTAVSEDNIYLMQSGESAMSIPNLFAPYTMHNEGNYIISLGNLCRWLAEQAEALEVEVFPGFTAAEVLFDDNNCVAGIVTGDMGVGVNGEAKDSYTPGMELRAKYTLFAEGCRGHLGKQLIENYKLDEGKDPQHYGIGIKELWKIPADKHKQGLVVHSAGWPLSESGSAGGGFLYHFEDNQVAVGLITDLSYSNPHVSPFDEFQRYKHHPKIAQYLEGGERIAYGARAITKGGLQSQPKMHFAGGLLIGDDAGTLNFAKIKGSHTAMKSGMVAAEVVSKALQAGSAQTDLVEFEQAYKESWAYKELHAQRNFGPAQHKWGNLLGSAYAFIDMNIFRGALPWTLRDPKPDYAQMVPAKDAKPINYSKPDNKLSFDKLSSVFLSNTNHEEDQPVHLKLIDPSLPIDKNLPLYNEPAQRYCPAGVYEVVEDAAGKRFQINAQNCVHCKTCDIKDPLQNITWVTPEGGGGPNYPNM
ncbi:electron transfer flavoprotein-ubiquinone oxidoreductase [Saccharophagus degradans]|uniref:electron transfer flavoprotein-ubiquinone oxidoreductase n=1 Tax=Saccharophagus degradans TaxID=86304 RepID=UPI002478225B|nr:electron transfer flavoprotein-ubiquinone oxidoreductase [Saccharophagus degradans]WGO96505.1 electron transfer flavoprotein-ubiquinone oxidoreductase [Saccharophagus degradans]